MGLDNGFYVKGIEKKDMPSYVKLPFGDLDVNPEGTEIVYWRKCYGLRRDVLGILDKGYAEDLFVERENIPIIIKQLIKYINPSYYFKHADSLWTYTEFIRNLIRSIINLRWIYLIMDESDSKISLYFYDSF